MTEEAKLKHRIADARWYIENREQRRLYKKAYDIAHHRPRPPQECLNCRAAFVRPYGTKKQGRFCSKKCKNKFTWAAYYSANRGTLISAAQTRQTTMRNELKAEDPAAYTLMRYFEHIKRKYGLGKEEYERMKAERAGRCDSCREEHDRLLIDHDHASGKVRGLLCNRCNVIAGYLEKNPSLLRKAAAYLLKHSAEAA